MGGQLHRWEPMEHSVLLSDVEVVRRFNACGWLGHFLKLTKFDEEAATEFILTFEEGKATIWELIVVSTKEQIAKLIGLPTIGEHYPNVHDARSARA